MYPCSSSPKLWRRQLVLKLGYVYTGQEREVDVCCMCKRGLKSLLAESLKSTSEPEPANLRSGRTYHRTDKAMEDGGSGESLGSRVKALEKEA